MHTNIRKEYNEYYNTARTSTDFCMPAAAAAAVVVAVAAAAVAGSSPIPLKSPSETACEETRGEYRQTIIRHVQTE
jgi:hypothetical protein